MSQTKTTPATPGDATLGSQCVTSEEAVQSTNHDDDPQAEAGPLGAGDPPAQGVDNVIDKAIRHRVRCECGRYNEVLA